MFTSDRKITQRFPNITAQSEIFAVNLRKKYVTFVLCLCDSDTVAERRALMENIYPRLYLYCKQRGYDFRMVDLRWGVGDPVAECHDTAELHVENLQRCQKTQGPNIVVGFHPIVLADHSLWHSIISLSYY
uniref:DUF4062 domain-containing protein n=1 Tax=Lates calcarifer TaxID=8187 RepID=A0A4W6FA55_LATCA